MLSRIDIEKELGKGINLSPFNPKNIKENSVNLSTSSYAWTMSSGKVFVKDNGLLETTEDNNCSIIKKLELFKGSSAVQNISGKDKIVLLPFSTTLIETQEVLAVNNKIGGTYHSKVGLVSQGLGHIGTMLGPNFSGHSLIAVHNVSEKVKTLEIGETFVSIVFHYLNSPINSKNPTANGHLDKMSELGIMLNQSERESIGEDWKCDISRVRTKMKEDENFIKYTATLKKQKNELLRKYINIKNIKILTLILILYVSLYLLALRADTKLKTPVWTDRFWSIGFSGIFVPILISLLNLIKPSQSE